LPGNCHTSGSSWEGAGSRGTAYAVTNQKSLGGDVTVGSQPLELEES
jgi:hypothetical protein